MLSLNDREIKNMYSLATAMPFIALYNRINNLEHFMLRVTFGGLW